MLKPWIALSLAFAGLVLFLAPAAFADVTEFPLPHADSRPYTIVPGPDGNLWFTESDRGTIGRITPSGTITEFPLEWQDSGPYGITVGADGNLWFTERFRNQIGKITTQGDITEYPLPTPDAQPWDITALPNGDLWFTEENVDQVGRITQNGTIDEYPSGIGQFPTFIATGADGNVWFTEEIGNDIVRLDSAEPAGSNRVPAHHRSRASLGHQPRPRREPLVHRARRPQRREDHARRNDH